jgi:hypothetical protein
MDEKTDFESVYSTFDRGSVALIKSLLESNGINYYIDNEHAAGLAAGQVSGMMNVMVVKNQVDLAEELLKDIKD